MSGPKWRCSAADIAVPGGSFGCWREETPYFGNWPRYNQDQPSKRKLNLTWFDMIQLALSGFQPISATANGSIGSGESNFPAGNNMEPTSEWLILCHFYHPTIRFVDFPRLKKGVLSEHRVSSEMPLLYQCWSTFSLIFVVFAGVYPPLPTHRVRTMTKRSLASPFTRPGHGHEGCDVWWKATTPSSSRDHLVLVAFGSFWLSDPQGFPYFRNILLTWMIWGYPYS